jgi:hypothetical protein
MKSHESTSLFPRCSFKRFTESATVGRTVAAHEVIDHHLSIHGDERCAKEDVAEIRVEVVEGFVGQVTAA